MKIIEQFIEGKKQDPALCEDGLFINDHFIAVIDGVTSKSDALFNNKAGGRAAMEKTCEVLSKADPESEAVDLFININKAVKSVYPGEPTGEAAAFAVVFSKAKNQIWRVGDCQFMINSNLYVNEKVFDRIVSDVRSLVLELARIEGKTDKELSDNDIGREFIMPVLKNEHLLANSKSRFGFTVLNGTDFDLSQIQIYDVKEGDTIVLASDGYPFLCSSLRESEKKLFETIRDNPLCDKEYSSTKGLIPGNSSFDDRTYIKFRV